MELKVVIDKKFAFIILGAVLILAGAIYGYAQSGVPNPGHDWNEIGNVPADLADGDADSFGEISGVQAKIIGGLTSCSGSNKAIKTINPETGEVTCETDDVGGSSGTFSCETKTAYIPSQSNQPMTVTCSSGYNVVGGGLELDYTSDDQDNQPTFVASYPSGNNRWICEKTFADSGATCYARCCKFT